MTAWRPTPFIVLILALQGLLLLPLWQLSLWPWAVAVVFLSHMSVVAAGLWPRSTLLGPNLRRLPGESVKRGEVAITIDDGPDPEVTPQVLAILAAHRVRATFFFIGARANAHPELCRAVAAGGHAIENHGLSHRKRISFCGLKGWRREVKGAQDILAPLAGREPRFFRPLAGLRNPFLEPVLHQLDMRLTSWSTRGFDTRIGDADRVLASLTQHLAAGDILLLHDGHAARTPSGQPVILAVLPRLLATLAQRQLKPVTLAAACNLT